MDLSVSEHWTDFQKNRLLRSFKLSATAGPEAVRLCLLELQEHKMGIRPTTTHTILGHPRRPRTWLNPPAVYPSLVVTIGASTADYPAGYVCKFPTLQKWAFASVAGKWREVPVRSSRPIVGEGAMDWQLGTVVRHRDCFYRNVRGVWAVHQQPTLTPPSDTPVVQEPMAPTPPSSAYPTLDITLSGFAGNYPIGYVCFLPDGDRLAFVNTSRLWRVVTRASSIPVVGEEVISLRGGTVVRCNGQLFRNENGRWASHVQPPAASGVDSPPVEQSPLQTGTARYQELRIGLGNYTAQYPVGYVCRAVTNHSSDCEFAYVGLGHCWQTVPTAQEMPEVGDVAGSPFVNGMVVRYGNEFFQNVGGLWFRHVQPEVEQATPPAEQPPEPTQYTVYPIRAVQCRTVATGFPVGYVCDLATEPAHAHVALDGYWRRVPRVPTLPIVGESTNEWVDGTVVRHGSQFFRNESGLWVAHVQPPMPSPNDPQHTDDMVETVADSPATPQQAYPVLAAYCDSDATGYPEGYVCELTRRNIWAYVAMSGKWRRVIDMGTLPIVGEETSVPIGAVVRHGSQFFRNESGLWVAHVQPPLSEVGPPDAMPF